MLHRIASAYGTDPETVLTWSPVRLRLALDCQHAAHAHGEREREAAAAASPFGVFPVAVVGGH